MATKLEINRKAAEEKGYIALAHQVEQANGIPTGVLVGLLEQESAWRPEVISGKKKSRAGAIGIAQFMPDTAADEGVDPLDPEAAIRASGKYLAKMKKSAGSWTGALTSYNWGIGNYRKWVSGKKKRQPKEAREYANKVQARARRFQSAPAPSAQSTAVAAPPEASPMPLSDQPTAPTPVAPSPELTSVPDAALIPLPDEPTVDPMAQSLLPNTAAAPSPSAAPMEQALIPEEQLPDSNYQPPVAPAIPGSQPLITPPEASMLPQRELPQRGQRAAKSILKKPKQIEVTVDTPAGPRQVLAENPEEEKLIQDLAHSGQTQLLTLMPELIQTRDLTRAAPLVKNRGDSVDTLLRQIIRGVK